MSSNIPTDQSVFQAIHEYRAGGTKSAAAKEAESKKVPDATDPNDKGGVSIPTADGSDKSKQNMPEDQKNQKAKQTLENESAGAAGLGEGHVPSTSSGNADEDSFTSPTSKIAAVGAAIMGYKSGEKPAEEPEKEAGAEKPAAEPTKAAEAPTEPAKPAAEPEKKADDTVTVARADLENLSFLAKLAQVALSTEHGIAAVNSAVRESAGVEAARDLLDKAAAAQAHWLEQGEREAALEQEHEKAASAFREHFESLAPEDQDAIVKQANVCVLFDRRITSELMKEAHEKGWSQEELNARYILESAGFQMGVKEAAPMMDAMAAGGGDMGAVPPPPGGGEAPIDDEMIIELLMAMVESGEIDQATAEAVIAQLQGEGGGGGGEEAMAAEEAAMMEGLPPEAKAAADATDALLAPAE